jgi:hypothetical protein
MKNRGWFIAGVAGLALGGVTVSNNAAQNSKAHSHTEACIHPAPKATQADVKSLFNTDPKTGKVTSDKFYACFDEGTDPEKIESFHAALDAAIWSNPEYYLSGSRWSPTVAGELRSTISWSLVPDGLSIPSQGSYDNGGAAGPSNLFATLDAQYASIGGRARWIAQIQAMFDRWSQLGGVTYVRRTAAGQEWDDGASWGTGSGTNRGNVRIAMRNIDGPSNILAYNFYPTNGDMLIDASFTWNSGSTLRFFRNVLSHEHGHGLGMPHVCPIQQVKLMEPTASSAFDGPQQDDIRHLHAVYGDKFEPNTSASTVLAGTAAATISANGTTTLGDVPEDPAAGSGFVPPNSSIISLHATGPDVDHYKFTLTAPRSIQVTARPIGSTYGQSQQASNGSCPAGVNINTLTIANLRLSLLNSSLAQIAFVDNAPAGTNEVTTRVTLPAGNYVAKVDAPTVSETQLYKIDISATAARELRGRLTVNGVTAFYPGEQVKAILTPTGGGASTEFTTTLATNGDYAFTLLNLPSGTYNLRIDGPAALITSSASFSVVDGIVTVNRTGRNGDIDNDGEVGPADFEIVVNNFGTAATSPTQGDVDRDGEVGPSDFELVVSAFGVGDV